MIVSQITSKQLYKICDEINKDNKNTILIYISTVLSISLIYYKYDLTVESIKYMSLIPFIIIISIIDYYTTNIYDITIFNGIIIQGIIFLFTINLETNTISHIIALITGFIVSYILSIKTKALGQGDIGVYCLCCFVVGHNFAIILILLSFLLACPYSMYIILSKGDKIRKIPFAPFISLSTITIIMINNDILNIYFDIISK